MSAMQLLENCFTDFAQPIANITLPERFTFPFCYEPHPLCLLAAEELQQKIQSQSELQQSLENLGRMFGVLIVKNTQGEIGYLSAFSGKQIAEQSGTRAINTEQSNTEQSNTDESLINFVPPVVDLSAQTDFFHAENKVINRLNGQLESLLAAPQLAQKQEALALALSQQNKQLAQHRDIMAKNKQVRKSKRSEAKAQLSGDELALRLKALAQESVDDKNQLRDLKTYWHECISQIQQQVNVLDDEIKAIKKTRKQLSTRLQKKLFKQYRLLNSAGEEKDLLELFAKAIYPVPPAGTGDCAAPKLLQYAFKHQLKPIAMAEFWWGKSPKSEIRQHKNFYPACSGKCQPILPHMLEGVAVDDNPLLINPALGKTLPIVYQDHDIVVVNKPHEFLSVPGKNIEDSVYSRIKQQFPNASGSYIVHRLDMSTSGLMVLALTKRAQKNLQQQFVNRQIKKRYVALLEGEIGENNLQKVNADDKNQVSKKQGEINLPLRGDLDDRPKQLVCFKQGKQAKTQWQVIETRGGKTKLYLYPETGRTHQLRVHCAHYQGLHMPILGDDLYGSTKSHRLHLHAQQLILSHPVTKEMMTFEIEEDF